MAALATYDFEIKYIPGSTNSDADGLSRLPCSSRQEQVEQISRDSVHAICCSVDTGPYILNVAIDAEVISDDEEEGVIGYTDRDWRREQDRDPVLRT